MTNVLRTSFLKGVGRGHGDDGDRLQVPEGGGGGMIFLPVSDDLSSRR